MKLCARHSPWKRKGTKWSPQGLPLLSRHACFLQRSSLDHKPCFHGTSGRILLWLIARERKCQLQGTSFGFPILIPALPAGCVDWQEDDHVAQNEKDLKRKSSRKKRTGGSWMQAGDISEFWHFYPTILIYYEELYRKKSNLSYFYYRDILLFIQAKLRQSPISKTFGINIFLVIYE